MVRVQNSVLGVTTLPWYGSLPNDGEVLHPWTLPAGLYTGYNLGNTCVWRLFRPRGTACTPSSPAGFRTALILLRICAGAVMRPVTGLGSRTPSKVTRHR